MNTTADIRTRLCRNCGFPLTGFHAPDCPLASVERSLTQYMRSVPEHYQHDGLLCQSGYPDANGAPYSIGTAVLISDYPLVQRSCTGMETTIAAYMRSDIHAGKRWDWRNDRCFGQFLRNSRKIFESHGIVKRPFDGLRLYRPVEKTPRLPNPRPWNQQAVLICGKNELSDLRGRGFMMPRRSRSGAARKQERRG